MKKINALCASMMFNTVLRQIVATSFVVSIAMFSLKSNVSKCKNKVLLGTSGRCFSAYQYHGNFIGAVRCPVCRQQVLYA